MRTFKSIRCQYLLKLNNNKQIGKIYIQYLLVKTEKQKFWTIDLI